MGKEIIHIEVDEDIAGIIGRVMGAREKVVAVVAPKNLGALRSVMNLKLLKKAAKNAGKIVVIISDNPAVANLAGVAGVALAPNLETKPAVPEVDLADGQMVAEELNSGEPLTIAGDLDGDGEDDNLRLAVAPEAVNGEKFEAAAREMDGSDQPQENEKKRRFNALTAKVDKVWQKALIIGGVGVVLLGIGIGAMMLFVRPQATVTLTTQMDSIDVRRDVRFRVNDNDVNEGLFVLQERTLEAEQVEEFEATGEREEGTRASGQITIRHCGPAMTISTEQSFSAEGRRYRISVDRISLEGTPSPCSDSSNWRSVQAPVLAEVIGEESNLSSGNRLTFSADPNGHFTEVTSNGISGGTRQIVRVVSENDVRNALARMDSTSVEEGRSRLIASLDDDRYAFGLTFTAENGAVEVTPRVGESVGNGGRATVRRTQVFKMMTASRSDMERFAMQLAEAAAGERQVYEIGNFKDGSLFLERIEITAQTGGTTCAPEDNDCTPTPGSVREIVALLKTVARAGDTIPEDAIRSEITNKPINEAEKILAGFKGVQRVSIDLTPFWARRIPRDQSRIDVNIRADD
jgi:hypothetical protein